MSKINEIDIFSIIGAAFELFSSNAGGQQKSCVHRRNRFRTARLCTQYGTAEHKRRLTESGQPPAS
ncbi:MAG: hypothetical protein J0H75_14330 [Rhizobiales bacterium]|nr:hypothetical protein [Hyphomicrobiales bacterium]